MTTRSTANHEQQVKARTDSFSLDKVIQQYASQPELLNLILSCKVEEDRRRAEEAKLKRKEIEYYIHQQPAPQEPASKVTSLPPPATLQPLPTWHHQPASPPLTLSSPRRASNANKDWRPSAIILPPLSSPPISYASTTSPKAEDALPSPQSMTDKAFPTKRPLDPLPKPLMNTLPSPKEEHNDTNQIQKRRRREMQAITTVIETREFPYNDDYLWRNNGNTVHKKSGNKSIYYKCANSQQGCPVNKTVTFKDNGEYLIKYRGSHLSDCSTIKRIHEV
ncbi:hypothetical protein DM01DRAFT_1403450 [Hesseltinella vesiculosa]|uniref:WRKY domain-containing protein n=1 Tax=Hesseltinella vesiculosa TaxID=101127 RepID=A0A1X2GY95_9FUNG|nr:hypothetical protein DM01DRAFT_1403450 [Hesseltinella vesiculosa]